ncbi:MAG: YhcH/YjgK/YiaL family protein [Clostridia bacterium]
MIIDRIENLGRYALIIKDCDKLVKFFEENPVKTLEPIRYELKNSDLTVGVFDYETKIGSKTRWETHHTHMDIHVIVTGREELAWIPAQHITQSQEYVAERDVEFFTDGAEGSLVLVEEGYFALVMPEDAHKPALAPKDEQRKGRKAVIKVEVR